MRGSSRTAPAASAAPATGSSGGVGPSQDSAAVSAANVAAEASRRARGSRRARRRASSSNAGSRAGARGELVRAAPGGAASARGAHLLHEVAGLRAALLQPRPRARQGRAGERVERAAGDRPGDVADLVERGVQRAAQRGERRARLRLDGHGGVDRAAQLDGQVAAHAVQGRQAHADPARGGGGVAGPDRVDARERLVEDDAERVDVDGGGDLLPARLLGRHVGERADDVAGAREDVVVGHPRDPEVGELRAREARLALGADDVGGLDVAVDDATLVGVRERRTEDRPDAQHVAVRQRPVAQQLGERRPLDELGHEVDGVLVAAGFVERDDPGVRQAGGGEGLALAAAVGVVADRDPLDGDVALEVLVAGAIDDAHAARAERRPEPVAVEDEPAGIGVRGRVGVKHRLPLRPRLAGSLPA